MTRDVNVLNFLQAMFFCDTRPCYKNLLNYDNDNNAENLGQYKSRFSLIVERYSF